MATALETIEADPSVFLDSTTTTILAESDQRRYAVHKALLCQKSGYFASAYNTSMKESSEDTFTISDVPDQAFRTLITWLYTGKVFLQPGQGPSLSRALTLGATDTDTSDTEDAGDKNAGSKNDDLDSDDESIRDGWYEDSDSDSDSNSSDDDMDYEDEAEPSDQAADLTIDPESEAAQISELFPGFSKVLELDAYQLSCLVRMHELQGSEAHGSFLDTCKTLLQNKLEEPVLGTHISSLEADGQEDIDVYNRLIDIYILADRFDIQGLRIDIMNLIEYHRTEQENYTTDSTLPNLSTIAKACENLPPTSNLRLWLVHGLAFELSAQAGELEILPRDFLADVLATMGQKVKWLWTKDD